MHTAQDKSAINSGLGGRWFQAPHPKRRAVDLDNVVRQVLGRKKHRLYPFLTETETSENSLDSHATGTEPTVSITPDKPIALIGSSKSISGNWSAWDRFGPQMEANATLRPLAGREDAAALFSFRYFRLVCNVACLHFPLPGQILIRV